MIVFVLISLMGCIKLVDNMVLSKVVPTGLGSSDLGKACALGESLSHPISSIKKTERSMVIAETTAGLCAELQVWEARLKEARALKNLQGASRVAEVKDARILAQRYHKMAATRYYRAFLYLESEYGDVGGVCPELKEEDEVVYVVGLVAGLLSVLNNKKGGGQVDISESLLAEIARGTKCVDNQKWWNTPHAIEGAVWASVPGSGPEDVDPWEYMKDSAEVGADTGVRVGWGFHNLIAANAGKTDILKMGIKAHAESMEIKSSHPNFALLDEYAYQVSLHESDLIWVQTKGYRTTVFGAMPAPPKIKVQEDDPFALPLPNESSGQVEPKQQ